MWFTVRCSYDTWSADYKRQYPAHNHDAQGAFVVAAKTAGVAALHGTGQAKYAHVALNDLGTTGLKVNLENDPGASFKQI